MNVLAKQMGFLKAEKSYDVSKATLINYVKKVNTGENSEIKEELVRYVVTMEHSIV